MDSQKWLGGSGSPISLTIGSALAEKYLKSKQEQNEEKAPIPQFFTKIYLKLLIAKKDFTEALEFLKNEGYRSFDLWLEEKMWRLKIQLAQDSTEDILKTLAEIISFNYENLKDSEKDDF